MSPALPTVLQQLPALSALTPPQPNRKGEASPATLASYSHVNMHISTLSSLLDFSLCFKVSNPSAMTLGATHPPFSSHRQLSLCTEVKHDCSTSNDLSPCSHHHQRVDMSSVVLGCFACSMLKNHSFLLIFWIVFNYNSKALGCFKCGVDQWVLLLSWSPTLRGNYSLATFVKYPVVVFVWIYKTLQHYMWCHSAIQFMGKPTDLLFYLIPSDFHQEKEMVWS